MLQYEITKPDAIVGKCDCGRRIEIALSGAEPNKLGYFLNPTVVCPCGARHASLRLPDELLVERNLSEEQLCERAEAGKLETVTKEELGKVMVLSLPSAEGYEVTQHFDIITAEVVLGTGFKADLDAGFADFFGSRSSVMEQKLSAAKQAAMVKLKVRALLLGADAVLSVDVDYHSLTYDLLMVIVTGTPVKLRAIRKA